MRRKLSKPFLQLQLNPVPSLPLLLMLRVRSIPELPVSLLRRAMLRKSRQTIWLSLIWSMTEAG